MKILSKKTILKLLVLLLFVLIGYLQSTYPVPQNDPDPQVNGVITNDQLYFVTSVVDGDTIKVSEIGTIRLIGVDTPETVDPRKEIQCFGIEASNKTKELLNGYRVRLEIDSSQGTQDKYGRTLAYVFREDGLFINLELIKQGYAYEYTYSIPYKYQKDFKNAQQNAKSLNIGLWSSCK